MCQVSLYAPISKPLCQQNGLMATRRKDGHGFDLAGNRSMRTPWMVLQGDIDQVCAPDVTRAFVAGVPGGIIRHYMSVWEAKRVILIGYSFGADVPPFLVNRLPDSLGTTQYRTIPESERLAVPVLCVRGADEESACRALRGTHITGVEVGSGHQYVSLSTLLNTMWTTAMKRMQIAARLCKLAIFAALASGPGITYAQEPPAPATPQTEMSARGAIGEAATRQAIIEQAQAAKLREIHPIVLSKGERVINEAEKILDNGLTWRPYFDTAYQGGGLPFGLGYTRHVSPYNTLDLRGSYTLGGYTRTEAEFTAPHLFHRRGELSILGGWREATAVGFYGIGQDTVEGNRMNFAFRQPYASATLRVMPTRRHWTLAGGLEWTEWNQRPGEGSFRSVDTLFTPQTLPGLGADVTYIHSQGTVGFDWRPFPGHARRGGYYGVTAHDYANTNGQFGFDQIDYEAIQHVPILRETWVVTLRGLAQITYDKSGQQIPFFMLPSLGGGSTLRGYSSWRFRDRNSLLLQAEWRIMVNRFFDTAVFYDTGKVAARPSDLDFNGMRHDWGVGFRFHSPDTTVLRIDIARSGEGTRLVFAAGHVF